MKLNKKYFFAVLSMLTFQIAFGMSISMAAMDSKDWADLFEIADTVLNDGSSSKTNQKSNNEEQEKRRAKTKSYEPSNSASGQSRSGSSGKVWNVDEATHCLQLINAVDERRCGRPGGYEFTVRNSCPEEIKYTLPLWKNDGKFTMLNSVHTVGPNSTGKVWGCDLSGQYGKYMSACFTRNWLKTCSPLNDSDYDENGNLIIQ